MEVPVNSPMAQVDAALVQMSEVLSRYGIGEAEGNTGVAVNIDPDSSEAAYKATVSTGPNGERLRENEHIEIGNDPFTGRSFAQAPDIVMHEFMHRVNEHTVPGLGASPTSRIVDEHIADTMASVADGNWTIGEHILDGGVRSLADPSTQQMLLNGERITVSTPTKMGEVTDEAMQLGPYWNIGPLNNAAYRIGEAIGVEKLGQLYIDTLRNHLHAGSATTDLIVGTVRSASDRYGAGSDEVQAVRDAWKAVGVSPAAIDAI